MKVVKNCSTLDEAYLAKNLLESDGIEADILDEATGGTAPYLLDSSGIRLAVADEDAPAARQVLGLPPLEETPPRGRRAIPGWVVFAIVVIALFSLFATSLTHRDRTTSGKAPHRKEYDRNGDGKIDKRVQYRADGTIETSFLDNNFDGVWDVRADYDGHNVISSERDLDFDGEFDMTDKWSGGILESETVTPGGKGNALYKYDYEKGILATKWEDPDRDGAWNTCISYDAMGRETDRKALR